MQSQPRSPRTIHHGDHHIYLTGPDGSAENAATWKAAGGCPLKLQPGDPKVMPLGSHPSSLTLVYHSRSRALKLDIAGEMCSHCYKLLIPNGWTTYSAPYKSGHIPADGTRRDWEPIKVWETAETEFGGMAFQRETIPENLVTCNIDGYLNTRGGRNESFIRCPSYEFYAIWEELMARKQPFYCDIVNLSRPVDPNMAIELQAPWITLENAAYYTGTQENLTFPGGTHTMEEIALVNQSGRINTPLDRSVIFYGNTADPNSLISSDTDQNRPYYDGAQWHWPSSS